MFTLFNMFNDLNKLNNLNKLNKNCLTQHDNTLFVLFVREYPRTP